ncbi:hypothetical protein PoB_004814900 [Plakobranchus ocellatus]|uniref:Uncharacterized protein n=1 Tax=Plakobranchus ocellatus TaxID=259542 RepID=A0AAV4BTF3_9GAST|nr:hypothetical protein PoB_004814900 [Plakobranchus ocellatus]
MKTNSFWCSHKLHCYITTQAKVASNWRNSNSSSSSSSSSRTTMISAFQALRYARAPVAGFEPATQGSLQISERGRYPLCHQRFPLTIQFTCALAL